MDPPQVEDGKVRLTVRARDDKKFPLTNVKFKVGLTNPSFKGPEDKVPEVEFEQVRPGVYEAEFSAEEVGNFFFTVQGEWADAKGNLKTDTVRGAASIPYSPEFAETGSKADLVDRVREITGGNRYSDDPKALEQVARSGELFRPAPATHRNLQPIWAWLVFLAGVCLVLEVGVRRIAIDPRFVAGKAVALWNHLRGRAGEEEAPVFLERLRSRKAAVGSELERAQAARRFEATGAPTGDVPSATGPIAPPASAKPPSAAPPVAPEKDAEAADFASRLLKAKKMALDERDKP
jgi:hypothetical protein